MRARAHFPTHVRGCPLIGGGEIHPMHRLIGGQTPALRRERVVPYRISRSRGQEPLSCHPSPASRSPEPVGPAVCCSSAIRPATTTCRSGRWSGNGWRSTGSNLSANSRETCSVSSSPRTFWTGVVRRRNRPPFSTPCARRAVHQRPRHNFDLAGHRSRAVTDTRVGGRTCGSASRRRVSGEQRTRGCSGGSEPLVEEASRALR